MQTRAAAVNFIVAPNLNRAAIKREEKFFMSIVEYS